MSETKYAVIETFEEFEGLADWHIHHEPDPDVAKLCIPCALKREIEALLAALEAAPEPPPFGASVPEMSGYCGRMDSWWRHRAAALAKAKVKP